MSSNTTASVLKKKKQMVSRISLFLQFYISRLYPSRSYRFSSSNRSIGFDAIEREKCHHRPARSRMSSDPRSCTGRRRRCSAARLIKRRRGARPLISGRRLAAGRSRDIQAAATSGVDGRLGIVPEKGVACWPVGRSGATRDRRAADRAGLGWGSDTRARWGSTAHSLSCFCRGEPRPAPFAPLKADTVGLIKTPTNK